MVMQQDYDPKHRSKSTTEWHQQKKIHLLEWPSQSHDLNLIAILWHGLRRAIHTRHPKNIAELKQFCKGEWSKIPPERCSGLICNYRERLVEVIAVKGGSTRYEIQGFTYFFHPALTVYTVCSIKTRKHMTVCVCY